MKRTRTDRIIVHCAYTPPDMDVGVSEIRDWHKEQGWSDIGYHYVIRRSGNVEVGRHLDDVGAHAKPWNSRSVGICLVGGKHASEPRDEANFTSAQFHSLVILIKGLLAKFPGCEVIGHRDVPGTTKTCPAFDVRGWWKIAGRG